MMFLYSILATGGLMKVLPYIGLGFLAAIVVVAFFIGLGKGWRRVSWGGIVWLVAVVAFLFVEKNYGAKIADVVVPKLTMFKEQERAFVCALLLALACVLAVLILYGIAALIFRPREGWQLRESSPVIRPKIRRPDDHLYDHESEDYDDYYDDDDDEDEEYHDYGEEYIYVASTQPSLFGRIFGALVCVFNVAAVAVVLGATILHLLSTTSLKTGALAAIYEQNLVKTAVSYASKYGVDALFMGILVMFSCGGSRKGFLAGLRSLIIGLGTTVAVVLGFYIPFSPFAKEGGVYFLHTFVSKCGNAITAVGLTGTVGSIVGKLFAGLILAAFVLVIMLLLNWLLKLAIEGISGVGFLESIDQALSCLVYLFIGLLVCLLVWAVIYFLGTQGIFDTTEIFGNNTILSQGIYDTFELRLRPIFEKIGAQISGFLKK